MKAEQIVDALNYLDDDLIEAVEEVRSKKKTPRNGSRRWTGIAACLCVLMSGILISKAMNPGSNDEITQEAEEDAAFDVKESATDLPMITIPEYSADVKEDILPFYTADLGAASVESSKESAEEDTQDRITSLPVYKDGEEIGDYPIITEETAKELLSEHRYITFSSYKMPGEEHIKDVELIYLEDENTSIPYYCFYAELMEIETNEDVTAYGIYYVPAVEEQYIENMPQYDTDGK